MIDRTLLREGYWESSRECNKKCNSEYNRERNGELSQSHSEIGFKVKIEMMLLDKAYGLFFDSGKACFIKNASAKYAQTCKQC